MIESPCTTLYICINYSAWPDSTLNKCPALFMKGLSSYCLISRLFWGLPLRILKYMAQTCKLSTNTMCSWKHAGAVLEGDDLHTS